MPVNELRARVPRASPSTGSEVQREEFKRLGVTGDWDDPYLTMDFHAEAVIADEFMKFVMNGSLYLGSKPVMWSPVEKTALAEAEVEYHDHQSPTIWVKFPISADLSGGTPRRSNGSRQRRCIWTTTPWTIPSNRGVAVQAASTTASIGSPRRPPTIGREPGDGWCWPRSSPARS